MPITHADTAPAAVSATTLQGAAPWVTARLPTPSTRTKK